MHTQLCLILEHVVSSVLMVLAVVRSIAQEAALSCHVDSAHGLGVCSLQYLSLNAPANQSCTFAAGRKPRSVPPPCC